jgi:hypothetical protein
VKEQHGPPGLADSFVIAADQPFDGNARLF